MLIKRRNWNYVTNVVAKDRLRNRLSIGGMRLEYGV